MCLKKLEIGIENVERFLFKMNMFPNKFYCENNSNCHTENDQL